MTRGRAAETDLLVLRRRRARRTAAQQRWRLRRRRRLAQAVPPDREPEPPAAEPAPVPARKARKCARCGCRLSIYHDPESGFCHPCQRRGQRGGVEK